MLGKSLAGGAWGSHARPLAIFCPRTRRLEKRADRQRGMTMQTGKITRLGGLFALMIPLMGCADGGLRLPGMGGDAASAETDAPARSVQLVERDVEAPEVFQKEERGLWDGRPSLGGVWVAHEAVREPERVIIRNQDNGKFVIGALFRKEIATPGPKFQVSSDAASALGMLAGAPARLSATALRREETPADPETSAAPVAEVDTQPLEGETSAAPAPAAPQSAPASGQLAKPFVQLGIFAVKANAERTAARMRDAGLPVRMATSTLSGKEYFRVLIGPANASSTRADYLAKAKAQGFADAYFVRN